MINMVVFENRTHFESTCDVIWKCENRVWRIVTCCHEARRQSRFSRLLDSGIESVNYSPPKPISHTNFVLSVCISNFKCKGENIQSIIYLRLSLGAKLVIRGFYFWESPLIIDLIDIFWQLMSFSNPNANARFPIKVLFCTLNLLFQWFDRNICKCNHAFVCAGSLAIAALSLI